MRETCTRKFPAWATIQFLFFLLSLSSSHAEGQCVDGTYNHEGRSCCLCGVGLKLVEHCTANLQYGKCAPCDDGTFRSHPSSEKTCERCRSCDHPNENLAEEKQCIASSDTKCRCKQDHYCASSTADVCHLCHPCKECGAEGVKDQCAGSNNTVCNEKSQDENGAGTTAAIVIGVVVPLLVVAALVAWYLRKKKRQQKPNGNAPNVELQPLNIPDVEIQPLIPEIASILGWRDMKNVALRSGISQPRIENCEQDHPGDKEEQTIQLMQIWAEHEGRKAPERLVKFLRESDKVAKAEKVLEVLRGAASNPV